MKKIFALFLSVNFLLTNSTFVYAALEEGATSRTAPKPSASKPQKSAYKAYKEVSEYRQLQKVPEVEIPKPAPAPPPSPPPPPPPPSAIARQEAVRPPPPPPQPSGPSPEEIRAQAYRAEQEAAKRRAQEERAKQAAQDREQLQQLSEARQRQEEAREKRKAAPPAPAPTPEVPRGVERAEEKIRQEDEQRRLAEEEAARKAREADAARLNALAEEYKRKAEAEAKRQKDAQEAETARLEALAVEYQERAAREEQERLEHRQQLVESFEEERTAEAQEAQMIAAQASVEATVEEKKVEVIDAKLSRLEQEAKFGPAPVIPSPRPTPSPVPTLTQQEADRIEFEKKKRLAQKKIETLNEVENQANVIANQPSVALIERQQEAQRELLARLQQRAQEATPASEEVQKQLAQIIAERGAKLSIEAQRYTGLALTEIARSEARRQGYDLSLIQQDQIFPTLEEAFNNNEFTQALGVQGKLKPDAIDAYGLGHPEYELALEDFEKCAKEYKEAASVEEIQHTRELGRLRDVCYIPPHDDPSTRELDMARQSVEYVQGHLPQCRGLDPKIPPEFWPEDCLKAWKLTTAVNLYNNSQHGENIKANATSFGGLMAASLLLGPLELGAAVLAGLGLEAIFLLPTTESSTLNERRAMETTTRFAEDEYGAGVTGEPGQPGYFYKEPLPEVTSSVATGNAAREIYNDQMHAVYFNLINHAKQATNVLGQPYINPDRPTYDPQTYDAYLAASEKISNPDEIAKELSQKLGRSITREDVANFGFIRAGLTSYTNFVQGQTTEGVLAEAREAEHAQAFRQDLVMNALFGAVGEAAAFGIGKYFSKAFRNVAAKPLTPTVGETADILARGYLRPAQEALSGVSPGSAVPRGSVLVDTSGRVIKDAKNVIYRGGELVDIPGRGSVRLRGAISPEDLARAQRQAEALHPHLRNLGPVEAQEVLLKLGREPRVAVAAVEELENAGVLVTGKSPRLFARDIFNEGLSEAAAREEKKGLLESLVDRARGGKTTDEAPAPKVEPAEGPAKVLTADAEGKPVWVDEGAPGAPAQTAVSPDEVLDTAKKGQEVLESAVASAEKAAQEAQPPAQGGLVANLKNRAAQVADNLNQALNNRFPRLAEEGGFIKLFGGREAAEEITEREFRVVTPEANDIVALSDRVAGREGVIEILGDNTVSRQHFLVTRDENRLYIMDLGSSNGTYVNGVKIEPKVKIELSPRDRIRVGRLSEFEASGVTDGGDLVLHRLYSPKVEVVKPQKGDVVIGSGEIVGRASDKAGQLDLLDPLVQDVSRQHFTVTNRGGRLYIRDLGSTNGTRVNANKINPAFEVEIKEGDVIGIGSFRTYKVMGVTENGDPVLRVGRDELLERDRGLLERLLGEERGEIGLPDVNTGWRGLRDSEGNLQWPLGKPKPEARSSVEFITPRRGDLILGSGQTAGRPLSGDAKRPSMLIFNDDAIDGQFRVQVTKNKDGFFVVKIVDIDSGVKVKGVDVKTVSSSSKTIYKGDFVTIGSTEFSFLGTTSQGEAVFAKAGGPGSPQILDPLYVEPGFRASMVTSFVNDLLGRSPYEARLNEVRLSAEQKVGTELAAEIQQKAAVLAQDPHGFKAGRKLPGQEAKDVWERVYREDILYEVSSDLPRPARHRDARVLREALYTRILTFHEQRLEELRQTIEQANATIDLLNRKAKDLGAEAGFKPLDEERLFYITRNEQEVLLTGRSAGEDVLGVAEGGDTIYMLGNDFETAVHEQVHSYKANSGNTLAPYYGKHRREGRFPDLNGEDWYASEKIVEGGTEYVSRLAYTEDPELIVRSYQPRVEMMAEAERLLNENYFPGKEELIIRAPRNPGRTMIIEAAYYQDFEELERAMDYILEGRGKYAENWQRVAGFVGSGAAFHVIREELSEQEQVQGAHTELGETESAGAGVSDVLVMPQDTYGVLQKALLLKKEVEGKDVVQMSNDELIEITERLSTIDTSPKPEGYQSGNLTVVSTGLAGTVSFPAERGVYKVVPEEIPGIEFSVDESFNFNAYDPGVVLVGVRPKEKKGIKDLVPKVGAQEPQEAVAGTDGVVTVQTYYDANGNNILDPDEKLLPWAGVKLGFIKATEEVDYKLTEGWNLVSFPVKPASVTSARDTLYDVVRQGGYATSIARWQDGRFDTYVERGGVRFGNDFAVDALSGYFVRNHVETDFVVAGNPIEDATLKLKKGYNLVGIPAAGYTADSVINAIPAARTVTEFDSGLYEPFVKQEETAYGEDFAIEETRGYFIRVEEDVIWEPN